MIARTTFIVLGVALLTLAVGAQQTRVNVTIENMAPGQGTFQTPVWIGFHNGTFDTYDGGTLASDLPIPGSVAIERLAEDGSTGPISSDFSVFGAGSVQATLAGPNGPIAPGDRSTQAFLLEASSPLDRYFSYASMVIPSNDAFIANGNPLAHPIFDDQGNFIAQDFFVAGPNAVNDAGTEANDELPVNTAFFGQSAPNTGVTESNPIITHPGFLPFGSGGILDDARFREGDFTLGGYPFLRVGFRAAPAITEFRSYAAFMDGSQEVPATTTDAVGITGMALVDDGETLVITVVTLGLENLIFGHLHLGAAGSNGPVVATLIPNQGSGSGGGGFASTTLEVRTADLAGPLAGFPLDELVRRMENGEIYVNLHSDDGLPGNNSGPGDFISGEIRGQVARFLNN
jgi:CHRD domain